MGVPGLKKIFRNCVLVTPTLLGFERGRHFPAPLAHRATPAAQPSAFWVPAYIRGRVTDPREEKVSQRENTMKLS